MDNKCNTVRLFASLNNSVLDIIEMEGTCFSKKEFIKRKYQESSKILLQHTTGLLKKLVKL